MPRRCTVCDHPNRKAIELALAEDRASIRKIADMHGIKSMPLYRHSRDHVRPAAFRAVERREDLTADKIVEKLTAVASDMEEMLAKAKKDGDPVSAARVAKEVISAWVFLGKTIGLFTNQPGTVHDNRTLILGANLDRLSADELRALLPARNGERQKAQLVPEHPEDAK